MRTVITAERWHEFCAGHKIYGHPSKCGHAHGHGYVATFTLRAELDHLGRVLDFSVIKSLLCEWLEKNWDHKMILWEQDPLSVIMFEHDPEGTCIVSFNPSAENMALHLLEVVGPRELANTRGVELVAVRVQETGKCSAVARLGNG